MQRTRALDLALLATPEFWKSQLVPEFLRDTVFQLRFLQRVSVELLTESVYDGWTVPVSILTDDDGEIASQLFVWAPDGSSRLRRASVFAFARGKQHVCAVVIEATPVYRKLYPMTYQQPPNIWQALRYTAADFLRSPFGEQESFGFVDQVHWSFDLQLPHDEISTPL